VLFAEHAGKEDEGGLRGEPSGLLQRLAAGETGQDEIRQDQIEAASL
jgi:hypothetical protein